MVRYGLDVGHGLTPPKMMRKPVSSVAWRMTPSVSRLTSSRPQDTPRRASSRSSASTPDSRTALAIALRAWVELVEEVPKGAHVADVGGEGGAVEHERVAVGHGRRRDVRAGEDAHGVRDGGAERVGERPQGGHLIGGEHDVELVWAWGLPGRAGLRTRGRVNPRGARAPPHPPPLTCWQGWRTSRAVAGREEGARDGAARRVEEDPDDRPRTPRELPIPWTCTWNRQLAKNRPQGWCRHLRESPQRR